MSYISYKNDKKSTKGIAHAFFNKDGKNENNTNFCSII